MREILAFGINAFFDIPALPVPWINEKEGYNVAMY